MRAAAWLAVLVFPAMAFAETITLVDGTKLSGEVIHTFRGVYTIDTPQGEVVLDKKKIKSIAFEAPAPREIYGSPEKTLEAWRSAALNGDEAAMLDAYALMYQGVVASEMESMGFKDKSQMIADVSKTKFTVKDRKVGKDKATLTVEQEMNGESRTGDIRFVLENGEWKMTP